MSETDNNVPLPELNAADVPATDDQTIYADDDPVARIAADLEAVFDVPVQSPVSSTASAPASYRQIFSAVPPLYLFVELGCRTTRVKKSERPSGE